MPHAFISYNDDVADLAANLRERLAHYQVSAWLFNRDRTLSENAWREIEDQIQKSHVVLFLISDRTNKSEGQIKEFDIALRFDKKVFPVVIEPVTFSSILVIMGRFYFLDNEA